jgi:hypothetical protein
VAVIAVAAVGIYWMFSGKNDKPYIEYTVSGNSLGFTFDGYMRITVVDETETQIKVKTETKIYMSAPGIRRTIIVNETETIWEDKSDSPDVLGTKTGSTTINTKWGDKVVDMYVLTEMGQKITTYVGQDDDVPYRMVAEESLAGIGVITLTFDLTKTNML